jgi:hypothetical protein
MNDWMTLAGRLAIGAVFILSIVALLPPVG